MLKAILFDKDGTLVELGDTWNQATVEIVNQLVSESDLSANDQETFKQSIGVTPTGIISNSTVAAGSIDDQAEAISQVLSHPVKDIAERIEAHYHDFVQNRLSKVSIVAEAVEVLQELKAKGYFLGIITNDNRSITHAMLKKAELLSYFDFIACADEYGSKPDITSLKVIERDFNIPLNKMIYVGDSSVDMIFGSYTHAAIGLALEADHHTHLHEADYIISSFSELIPIIEDINLKQI